MTICECEECVAARKWIAEKTGVGGGPRPLSFLIASHETMAAERKKYEVSLKKHIELVDRLMKEKGAARSEALEEAGAILDQDAERLARVGASDYADAVRDAAKLVRGLSGTAAVPASGVRARGVEATAVPGLLEEARKALGHAVDVLEVYEAEGRKPTDTLAGLFCPHVRALIARIEAYQHQASTKRDTE